MGRRDPQARGCTVHLSDPQAPPEPGHTNPKTPGPLPDPSTPATPPEMRLSEAGCVRREGASKRVPEAGKRLEEVAKAVGAVTVGYKRH